MNRKNPPSPPVVKKDERPGWVTEIRKYKIITPLYGGGEETQKADSVTTVRTTEVRGHLRFWWRATRGGLFSDLKMLHKAEGKIWGSAAVEKEKDSGPSDVKIVVQTHSKGEEDKPFEVVRSKKSGKPNIQSRPGSIVPSYAAFPLQPKKEDAIVGMETLAVRVGVEFALEITYPKSIEKDVQAALWAWETFGGIGGRTRRGFGALKLDERWVEDQKVPTALPQAGQVKTELEKQLKEYLVADAKWPVGVPHIAHILRMKVFPKNPVSPIQAWRNLIERYQYFRQFGARVDKTTGEQKNQGLSLWPEANVLRARLKRPAKWPKSMSAPQLADKFPRAAFGLPILFHLPHDGDGTFTVQGDKLSPTSEKSYERLASRLILKPLACANDQYVGIAFVLHGPPEPPTGLQIKETLPVRKPVKWKLEESEAGSEPLNKILHGQPDVLQAFLDFLN